MLVLYIFGSRMITHTLYGGLGNQLFQIFTVIALSLKSGHEFYFEYKEDSLLKQSSLLTSLLPFCKSTEECRALEQYLHVHHIREPESHQYDAHCFDKVFTSFNHEHLFILEGYFQSYLYFQNEFDTIVQMLTMENDFIHQWSTIFSDIIMSEGVAIHFRLGDYKHLQNTHIILPCNYYRNALQYISGKTTLLRVVYVCQQEDQEIVESYYIPRLSQCFPQCTWISIYDIGIDKDEEQLLYMSLMKFLVIANSTFSLWAAYLNNINNDKCICYPSTWIKNLWDATWNMEFDVSAPTSLATPTPTSFLVLPNSSDLWSTYLSEFASECGNAYSEGRRRSPEEYGKRMRFVPHISNIIHPPIVVEDMFLPSWNRIETILDNTIDNIMTILPTSPIPMTQCLCYKNEMKKNNMIQRFATIGLPLQIYEGVPFTDSRIINERNNTDDGGDIFKRNISLPEQRLWSVTYGHLDMIQRFLDTEQPYGLFCEDDILVNRTLPDHIQNIIEDCQEMCVDCLLLGYMTTFNIEGWMQGYEEIRTKTIRPYHYHNYPDELWGVHMYMLSRAGALKIIETYAHGYADIPNHVFSPDWTISKCPGVKRAIIYPMFAVEDGKDTMEHYNHEGQYQYHMNTFKHNYIPGVFI
jgi:Glycosyl transferase family 11